MSLRTLVDIVVFADAAIFAALVVACIRRRRP